jgi:hypothetical protein
MVTKQEKLLALANRIDHEELWRWAGMDREKLTPEQEDHLDAGVALRRYADILEPGRWLVIPPVGSVQFSASTLDKAVKMARPGREAVPQGFVEALQRALAQPTLELALSFICTWENERAVDQAINRPGTGSNGARWDTCFDHCVREVLKGWSARTPIGTEQLLALERRSNMTDDEAIRYGRSVESLVLRRAAPSRAAADFAAAVDAEYPLPDSPHASVIQRATDNRSAMWRGINAARAILAPPTTTTAGAPVDMVLHCPNCHLQHVDALDDRTPDWTNPPHRSHLCHGCGHIWRPADVPTNGVKAIVTKGKSDSAQVAIDPVCCGNPDNCPKDYRDCPHGGLLPTAKGRGAPLDDNEVARLRRVVRALGMEREVPDDAETLRGCLFSVLGQIARKFESRATLVLPESALQNWLNIIHDNEYALGDRLQRVAGLIRSILNGDAHDRFPPHVIREQVDHDAVLEKAAQAIKQYYTGLGGPPDDPHPDAVLVNSTVNDCVNAVLALRNGGPT